MNYENSYLLQGSEMLSEKFNEMACYYSDFYKELYGFRPYNALIDLGGACACDYPNRAALIDAFMELRNMCADLEVRSKAVFAEREAKVEKSIAAFEKEISDTIEFGAENRSEVIKWICQANNADNVPGRNGWEYLEYRLGIPFGYIANSMKEAA